MRGNPKRLSAAILAAILTLAGGRSFAQGGNGMSETEKARLKEAALRSEERRRKAFNEGCRTMSNGVCLDPRKPGKAGAAVSDQEQQVGVPTQGQTFTDYSRDHIQEKTDIPLPGAPAAVHEGKQAGDQASSPGRSAAGCTSAAGFEDGSKDSWTPADQARLERCKHDPQYKKNYKEGHRKTEEEARRSDSCSEIAGFKDGASSDAQWDARTRARYERCLETPAYRAAVKEGRAKVFCTREVGLEEGENSASAYIAGRAEGRSHQKFCAGNYAYKQGFNAGWANLAAPYGCTAERGTSDAAGVWYRREPITERINICFRLNAQYAQYYKAVEARAKQERAETAQVEEPPARRPEPQVTAEDILKGVQAFADAFTGGAGGTGGGGGGQCEARCRSRCNSLAQGSRGGMDRCLNGQAWGVDCCISGCVRRDCR